VLEHLLDNALKFTPRGGRVDVAVSLPGDLVLVEVRDTGVGIAAEHLPHLFEKFYQADASLTRSHGGAGLGLSLVKAFVEAHGGQVGVMSEVGQGSRFWFSVPTGPSPSPARPA
jgi:signal transduction histidine kinase